MTHFLYYCVHFLIVAAMVSLIVFILRVAHEAVDSAEKLIRAMSMGLGFLIYYGARAAGVSIPDIIMRSMQNPSRFGLAVLGILAPTGVGMLVAWYIVNTMKSNDVIARRLVILVSVFVLVLFADVYRSTFGEARDGGPNALLLPNLSYVVGMGLYLLRKIDFGGYFQSTVGSPREDG